MGCAHLLTKYTKYIIYLYYDKKVSLFFRTVQPNPLKSNTSKMKKKKNESSLFKLPVTVQMNYSTNFPALPPLPAATNIPVAPGVVANTPLNDDNILAAQEETAARKKLRIRNPTAINTNQLTESIIRKQAIINEHAAMVYAGAGAPGWFAPAIAPINAAIAANTTTLAAINTTLAAINTTLAAINTTLAANTTAIAANTTAIAIHAANQRIFNRNTKVCIMRTVAIFTPISYLTFPFVGHD
jgi:hypothetical protein